MRRTHSRTQCDAGGEIVSLGKSSSDQHDVAPEMSTRVRRGRGHVTARGAGWANASYDVMVTRMPWQRRQTLPPALPPGRPPSSDAVALAESTFMEGFQRFG